jgi:EmrB/QacA subfamily drug resistance transporter
MSTSEQTLNGGPAVEAPNPLRWKAMAVLALVQFMLALDNTVVNVALPSIQTGLGFSDHGIAWVVNAYTLTAGGFLILGGRAADFFGRKRLFFIGVSLFALASLASGVSQSSGTLVAARFIQGLGEAIAAPAALSLVVLLFVDPVERAKAIGAWGGITAMGATLGVVLSGIIVSAISWRWIFFINLPVAMLALFAVSRMVKESRVAERKGLDWIGAVLVTASLTLIVDGLLSASTHSWSSAAVLVPLLIGVPLLIAFVISQAVIEDPLVPLRFFRNRTRISANLATMLMLAGFLSMFFLLTLYMQDVLHYSAFKTGMVYLPYGIAILFGIVTTVKLMPKVGVKVGLTGAYLICAVGLFLMSGIKADSSLGDFLPGMLLMAYGQGIAFPALQNAALHQLDYTDAGLGSAVQQTSLQLGGSLGLAVLVTVSLRHTASKIAEGVAPSVAATDGYALAIKIGAFVLLAGAAVVALGLEKVKFVPPEELALEAAEAAAGAPPSDHLEGGAAPAEAGSPA